MSKELNDLKAFLTLAVEVLKTTQKGSRDSIKYVYSDDEKIVVTDGHILVTLDKTTENIAPGFYNIAKVGKELTLMPSNFDGKYPNYKMVIPDYKFKPLTIAFTKTEYMLNLIKLQNVATKYCGGYVREQHFELLKKSEFIYQVFTPEKECSKEEFYQVLFKSNKLTIVAMPKPLK